MAGHRATAGREPIAKEEMKPSPESFSSSVVAAAKFASAAAAAAARLDWVHTQNAQSEDVKGVHEIIESLATG